MQQVVSGIIFHREKETGESTSWQDAAKGNKRFKRVTVYHQKSIQYHILSYFLFIEHVHILKRRL